MSDNWYNNIEKIAVRVNNLADLQEFKKLRREAGYDNKERMQDIVLFGKWWSDCCGNFGPIHVTKDYKDEINFDSISIPKVLTRDGFVYFLEYNFSEKCQWTYALSGRYLPANGTVCPECRLIWKLENCFGLIPISETIYISGENYIGLTFNEVVNLLNQDKSRDHSISRHSPVRNYMWINHELSEYGKKRSTEENFIRSHYDEINPFGWATSGILREKSWNVIDFDSYKIQEGDEISVSHFSWYHPNCLINKHSNEFLSAVKECLRQAEYPIQNIKFVPNEYGSREYRGDWLEVFTDYGILTIGWRKRVIEIRYGNFDLTSLFINEQVTNCPGLVHAWGYEKLTEYLKLIKDFMEK